jgi:hypothetical protein
MYGAEGGAWWVGVCVERILAREECVTRSTLSLKRIIKFKYVQR